jgi:hypothetical protein
MDPQYRQKRSIGQAVESLYGPVTSNDKRQHETVREAESRLRTGLRPANSVAARQTRVTY